MFTLSIINSLSCFLILNNYNLKGIDVEISLEPDFFNPKYSNLIGNLDTGINLERLEELRNNIEISKENNKITLKNKKDSHNIHFVDACLAGDFTDDNVIAYYATQDKNSNIRLLPSDILERLYRNDFEYVVYHKRY